MRSSLPRRRTRLVAAAMGALLLVAACSNGSSPTEEGKTDGTTASTKPGEATPAKSGFNEAQFEGTPQQGGEITFGVESTIATLDPAGNMAQPADLDVAFAIYDQLVDYDEEGNLTAGLATEWTNSDDLKTWTFTLREGVQFSDGTPFNADAVLKHFARLKDPATKCTCAPNVALIDSVEAPDATTVVFKLVDPNAFFPSTLTGNVGFVASPTATAKWGIDYPRHPVGTGPFVLESFDSLVLTKNPNYWRKDDNGVQLPYLDKITVKPIPDATVRLQSLGSGDIDALQTADTGTVIDAVKADSYKIQKITGSSATIIIFNLRKPPFDDLRVRRALALAVNRDELNKVSYGGARQPAYSPFAADSPFFADIDWPTYDPTEAKRLVAELKGEGVDLNTTATCIATPEGRNGLAVVQRNAQAVGLNAENEFLDQGAYVNKVIGANHDFTVGCFRSPQIANADGLFTVLHSDGSGNVMGYSNPKVDKALEDIRKTVDPDEHIRLLKIVQEEAAKDVPSLPLLYDLFANIYTPEISGFPVPQPDYLGAIKFTTLYRKK